MKKVSTPEQIEKVANLYKQGVSRKKIAEEMNCSVGAIYYCLEKSGFIESKNLHRKLSSDQIVFADKLYRQGMKLQMIANIFEVSMSTIVSSIGTLGTTSANRGEEIVSLYKSGKDITYILEHLPTNKEIIVDVLKRNGIELPKPIASPTLNLPNKKFTPESEAEVVERYKKGESLNSLIKEYNCSWVAIRRLLKRNGLEIKKRGVFNILSPERIEQLKEMSQSGCDRQTLMNEFGISSPTLNRWLLKLGIKTKNRGSKGKEHHNWSGGKQIIHGYVKIWISPDDPYRCMANTDGYVLEHRYVMAKHLGHPLDKKNQVHHLDGNRQNNDISNLQFRDGPHGNGIVLRCMECNSDRVSTKDGYTCVDCGSFRIKNGEI